MSDQNIDKAFILCAGYGKRLRPYTLNTPKPLAEINEKPLLEYTLRHLKNAGVRQIVINTHHLTQKINDFLENWSKQEANQEIVISHESELLDTGGGIKKMLPYFNDQPFYAINGDAFWLNGSGKNSLLDLQKYWRADDMDILILLEDIQTMQLTQGVGDYDLNSKGQAIRSLNQSGQYMFSSIRINHPRIFENTPDHAFSYLECLDHAQNQNRLYGQIHEGTWHHISTIDDLERVRQSHKNSKVSHA